MRQIFLFVICIFYLSCLQAQSIKVLSYNIHHGANTAGQDRLDSMAYFIAVSGADIVALQEVDSLCKRTNNVDQAKRLAELTGMHYAFVRHMAYDGGAYGQAILSKYPISDISNHRLTLLKKDGGNDSRALLAATILVNGNPIRFACAHFALDTASRLIQAAETIEYLMARGIPVILAGDLNTTDHTEEISMLEKKFTPTDRKGIFTFSAEQPSRRIDYIFISHQHLRKIKSHQVFTDQLLSDHLPLMATVLLK
jgi:endonuclease/exonuclease/phosphatase family metal-dependent hydrolase